jgi:hypothetical protein
MGRSVGLPLTLVALVVGGILFAMQLQGSGSASPASSTVAQAETQAVAAVASTNFAAANAALQAWFAEHGSYAGATIDPSYQVTVVRADAASYCLQTAAGQALEHENGPGGQALPGGC